MDRLLVRFIGAAIFIFFFQVSPVQAKLNLNSQYYCLMDRQTGQVIAAKNADVSRQAASTTKIMTAVLVNDYVDLNETAQVSNKADRTPEYTIGLKAGQKLTVYELLKVCLIKSANDAAVVLAEHVAGDEEFFAYLMSKKAFLIGAVNTFYKNASGLPDNEYYTNAYDLAVISRYALTKDVIMQLVSTRQTTFKHPGYLQVLTITNTNALLNSYAGADGIKTGTANASGKCLAASATRGDNAYIAIVLNSSNRTGDCARLLDYGFNKTRKEKILDKTEPFKYLRIKGANKNELPIYAEKDFYVKIGEEKINVEKKVTLNYNHSLPIRKGQVIGRISFYIEGNYLESVALLSGEDILPQSGLFRFKKLWDN